MAFFVISRPTKSLSVTNKGFLNSNNEHAFKISLNLFSPAQIVVG